ncbi:MAG TPA: inositol monophosphatase [Clostridiales bacterium]|nr:inositol monophosphatase [Clostridiales bacterium]
MLDNIVKVVKDAGDIILKARHIQEHVESKQGQANFVTKYDVEVQEFLYRELSGVLPQAGFIGEEDDGRDDRINDGYCFIIDPIDGTTNFIFDYRHSCISVALMLRGEIILGVVYNPYLEELFTAEKGKGAFLNGRPLRIRDTRLEDGVVAFGTAPYYREKADETFRIARSVYDKALDLRRSGSAALDICYVAAGRIVLYYELLLSPWDYAAASLVLTEAGGRISTMEGRALSFDRPVSVLAGNKASIQQYFELF